MATATPAVADQMAMAWARSRRSVKTLVMIDSVAGMISAAPMPMIARVAMRWLASVANAEAIDAVPMIVRPMARAPRRPNRSPSEPIVSSRPAKTRMYESTTHWSWLVEASSSRCSVGRATFTIVLSITISSRLRHMTASTIQRRGSRVGGRVPRWARWRSRWAWRGLLDEIQIRDGGVPLIGTAAPRELRYARVSELFSP